MKLYIGFVNVCKQIAKQDGEKLPRIVFEPSRLCGYTTPLELNLCGNFTALSTWEELVPEITRLKDKGATIKIR